MSDPIIFEEVGGKCPCQAIGTAWGLPFYFRARGGGWTLAIGFPGSSVVGCCGLEEGVIGVAAGDDSTHGHMEAPAAESLIRDALARWRSGSIDIDMPSKGLIK